MTTDAIATKFFVLATSVLQFPIPCQQNVAKLWQHFSDKFKIKSEIYHRGFDLNGELDLKLSEKFLFLTEREKTSWSCPRPQ